MRDPDFVTLPAGTLAARLFADNTAALRDTQPSLAHRIAEIAPQSVDWTYARDGSLTARDAAGGGGWWNGCSVPLAAARAMLAGLDVRTGNACFLQPPHGAHLAVALDAHRREQAIFAVVPDAAAAWVMLHVVDLAADVRAHRLWLAAGADWAADLGAWFDEHPGLATPAQFIRVEDAAADHPDRLIEPAQRVLSEIVRARAERMRTIRAGTDLGCAVVPPTASVQIGSQGAASRETAGVPVFARCLESVSAGAASCETAGMLDAAPRQAGRDPGMASRAAAGAPARSQASSPSPTSMLRICVIAPGRFRLWDDAGPTLAQVIARPAAAGGGGAVEWVRFDPDAPLSASPLALAELIATCDAVVAANAGRRDLPEVALPDVPWVTWVTTTPRVPAFDPAGSGDSLLMTDPAGVARATAAGWPADRVGVAGWPYIAATDGMARAGVPGAQVPQPSRTSGDRTGMARAGVPGAQPGVRSGDGQGASHAGSPDAKRSINDEPAPARHLALLADTRDLIPPAAVEELSSHRLLWETIRDELLADPFAAAGAPGQFLDQRMRRHGITPDGFDRRRFLEDLIVPAVHHGLARALLEAGLPVRCHGHGWASLAAFRSVAAGPVASRDAFARAVSAAAAVVHPSLLPLPHAADVSGRPVVRVADRSRETFLAEARLALVGRLAPPPPAPAQPLSMELLLHAVRLRPRFLPASAA